MEYRRLGRAGLKVSVLSYGTWITFAEQGDLAVAVQTLTVARRAGINFFDTADAYRPGPCRRAARRGARRDGLGSGDLRPGNQRCIRRASMREHAADAQPEVSDAGNRRIPRKASNPIRRCSAPATGPILILPLRKPSGPCPTLWRPAKRTIGGRRSGPLSRCAPPGKSPIPASCASQASSSLNTTCSNVPGSKANTPPFTVTSAWV